jgi:hypothetical protein
MVFSNRTKHSHTWFQLIDCEIKHVNLKDSCGKIFSDFLILKICQKPGHCHGGGGGGGGDGNAWI